MQIHEAILVGIIVDILILALPFSGYQGHLCKIEEIKAGMKGDEVKKACK